MEEDKEKQEKNFENELCKQVNNKIQEILEVNIDRDNIDYLGKLVDIKKDMENIEYWNIKEEVKYNYEIRRL